MASAPEYNTLLSISLKDIALSVADTAAIKEYKVFERVMLDETSRFRRARRDNTEYMPPAGIFEALTAGTPLEVERKLIALR